MGRGLTTIWTLVGPDREPYASNQRGLFGGHRRSRIYGRLDCPSALRAIARGGYVNHRVFFLTEDHARAAGYRPCSVCLPTAYARRAAVCRAIVGALSASARCFSGKVRRWPLRLRIPGPNQSAGSMPGRRISLAQSDRRAPNRAAHGVRRERVGNKFMLTIELTYRNANERRNQES